MLSNLVRLPTFDKMYAVTPLKRLFRCVASFFCFNWEHTYWTGVKAVQKADRPSFLEVFISRAMYGVRVDMTKYLGDLFAILKSAALLFVLSVLMLKAEPQSLDSQATKGDPVLGERIAGGIVFEGKLWLWGVGGARKDFEGGLISLSLADGSRKVHFESGVLDIKKLGHDLCVLRGLEKGAF